MIIEFPNATILRMEDGVSKAGNPYGLFKFLSQDYQVFELFCMGEALEVAHGIQVGTVANLVMDMTPRRSSAGIDLVLKGCR